MTAGGQPIGYENAIPPVLQPVACLPVDRGCELDGVLLRYPGPFTLLDLGLTKDSQS